jgi:hypothetical protein
MTITVDDVEDILFDDDAPDTDLDNLFLEIMVSVGRDTSVPEEAMEGAFRERLHAHPRWPELRDHMLGVLPGLKPDGQEMFAFLLDAKN